MLQLDDAITLSPAAEECELARIFGDALRKSLQSRHRQKIFSSLKGTVFLVASDLGEAISFRFDMGKVVIHYGMIGSPTITLYGSRNTLVDLTKIQFVLDDLTPASIAWQTFLGALKVYGWVTHPRCLFRFLSIVRA